MDWSHKIVRDSFSQKSINLPLKIRIQMAYSVLQSGISFVPMKVKILSMILPQSMK